MKDIFQEYYTFCPANGDDDDDDFNNFKWLNLFMTKVGHQVMGRWEQSTVFLQCSQCIEKKTFISKNMG